MPAILAGFGATVLLWLRAPRSNFFELAASAAVIGLSSFLVTLTSDARGYAPMLVFGLLSWLCMERFHESGRTRDAALFWITAVAAFLCQLIFIEGYLLLLFWSALRVGGGRARQGIREFLLLHTVPLTALAGLYLIDIRSMHGYGNPGPGQLWELLGLGSMIAGLRPDSVPGMLAAILVLALLGAAYRSELRTSLRNPWTRVALGTGVAVAALSALFPSVVVTRYLLPLFVLLLLLTAHALARLWRRGTAGKSAATAFLIVCIAGNAAALSQRVRYGWGSYAPALQYILRHDRSDVVAVGGNQEFRIQVLLEHYASMLDGGGRLRFAAASDASGPAWLLIEKTDLHLTVPARTVTRDDGTYALAAETYEKGAYWVVYRKTNGD